MPLDTIPRRLSSAEALEQRRLEAAQLDEDGKGFVTLDFIRKTAEPPTPIWGSYLFRKTVTMIVGDPGIMKTTFGYAMAMSLCRGESFLSQYADTVAKVLYLDFESSPSLIMQRADLIDPKAGETPGFEIWPSSDYTLPELQPLIIKKAQTQDFNIIIIDNQTTAFSTFDENDNAEAGKQIHIVRNIADEANAAVILYHHPNKMLSAVIDPSMTTPGLNKGSGAGARARLVDILFNLNRTTGKDLVQLECAKDRIMGNQGEVKYIMRKIMTVEDVAQATFTLLDELPPGVALEFTPSDKPREKAKAEILQLLMAVDSMSHTDLQTNVRKDGIQPATINRALSDLRRSGRVIANYKGVYGIYASRQRIEMQKDIREQQEALHTQHNGRHNANLSD